MIDVKVLEMLQAARNLRHSGNDEPFMEMIGNTSYLDELFAAVDRYEVALSPQTRIQQ